MPEYAKRYLGDAVYAHHDGYQIWLTVEGIVEDHEIALDLDTMIAVKTYIEQFIGGRLSAEPGTPHTPDPTPTS